MDIHKHQSQLMEEASTDAQSSTSSSSCTSALSLTQMGISHIPSRYVLSPSERPNPHDQSSTTLPVIDMSSLHDSSHRSQVLDEIRRACEETGFFQVINHGVALGMLRDALGVATDFFNLPAEDKMTLFSDDVRRPVRYGTSMNRSQDEVYCWRDFIKQYSHPLSKWIEFWPSNPPRYREKMGNYTEATHKLHIELMEVILESLGLKPNYMKEEIEEGSQVMVANCYPACPEPDLTLGMPQHSDYGSITILLQSGQGLEVMDKEEKWIPVLLIEGALIVQLGDQMEVLSNGRYKSVVHRVRANGSSTRLSLASLHSLAIQNAVKPATELVDEEHPVAYKGFSFQEFLDFVSVNDISKGRFIEKLKLKNKPSPSHE